MLCFHVASIALHKARERSRDVSVEQMYRICTRSGTTVNVKRQHVLAC